MVVAPVNTLKNWGKEFEKWIPSKYAAPTVFQLSDVGADTADRYAGDI
jgi:SNF2 family DNA or RNA helicase